MSFAALQFIANRLVNTLSRLHNAGVAHYDVKPENVVFNTNGIPILIDFGMAEVFKTSDLVTTARGTPKFLPPEVTLGHVPLPYDPFMVDVYGLGATIFTLLFKSTPEIRQHPEFGSDNIFTLAQQSFDICSPELKSFFLRTLHPNY